MNNPKLISIFTIICRYIVIVFVIGVIAVNFEWTEPTVHTNESTIVLPQIEQESP